MSREIPTEFGTNVVHPFTDIAHIVPLDDNVEYVREDEKDFQYVYPKFLNYTPVDTNIQISIPFVRQLGKGTFGTVLLYSSEKGQYRVALKVTDDDHEVKNIQEQGQAINELLSVKIIGVKNAQKGKRSVKVYYIAMQAMDGSLLSMIYQLNSNVNLSVKICMNITTTLKNLYEKGYVYTDLKLENVLYRYIGSNTLSITIGDIGSVVKKGTFYPHFSYTYIPYSYTNVSAKADEKLSVWLICYMLLTTVVVPDAAQQHGALGITNSKLQELIEKIDNKVLSDFFNSCFFGDIDTFDLLYNNLKMLDFYTSKNIIIYEALLKQQEDKLKKDCDALVTQKQNELKSVALDKFQKTKQIITEECKKELTRRGNKYKDELSKKKTKRNNVKMICFKKKTI